MVMAISLNEMCRYPESMNVIQSFRKNYFDSYQWLRNEISKSKTPKELYHLAVAYTKKDPTFNVPHRIASQWIRSPLFLADQEQINLLFGERTYASRLTQQTGDEKKAQILKIVKSARALYQRLKFAKTQSKGGSFVTPDLIKDVKSLKAEVTQFQRMKGSEVPLRKILVQGESKNSILQKVLVDQIGSEIARLNGQMGSELEEIAENIELLEVEIWNGAGEDIVWQNAHPGYKAAALQMKESKTRASAGRVWDWGKIEGGFDGKGEIWEDEVGSLSADLYDNCESKDKFLGLKEKPPV